MDRGVGFTYQSREVIDYVTGRESFVPPMPRETDVVDHLVLREAIRANSTGHEGLGFDRATGSGNPYPVRVLDTYLVRMFRRDFAEQLGLQFR